MALTKMVVVVWALLMVAVSAEAALTLTPTPAPAPAPALQLVNLTDLLSLAGPFNHFLTLLQSTDLLKTVQGQANDTQHGVTVFAPSDPAFASLKSSALGNLTADQKKAVVLAHVMSRFYTLQDFQNFSNPASTMASGVDGGKYNMNITAKSGAVSLSTGYVTAPITSTVHVTYPVAVYTVSKVLLPEDIFGEAVPSPAPSPSPLSSDADAPVSSHSEGPSANSPAGETNANASGAWICKPLLLPILLGALPFLL